MKPSPAYFVFVGVGDRIVHLGAGRLGCCYAAAELNRLHRLQAHQRLREQAVETLVPVGVRADARRQAVHDDLEDAADGVAGAQGFVDLGLHRGFGLGVGAGEQHVFALGDGGDFVEGDLARKLRGADANDVACDVRRRAHVASSFASAPQATRAADSRALARSST